MLTLVLTGTVPSKKNSRINTGIGRSFPSTRYTFWQNGAIIEVRQQTRHRFIKPVSINVVFYMGDLRTTDLDNKLSSVLDMLKECLVIVDDSWQRVPEIHISGEYRKGKPGAEITITELENANI